MNAAPDGAGAFGRPLDGIRVLDLGGVGPGPFASMLLADLGAEVVAVVRSGGGEGIIGATTRAMSRGKRELVLDLKAPEDRDRIWQLIESSDVLAEGFRPGVMERLGFGPEQVHARCPALVYARVTGWGRTGPLAGEAGHDINYIALAGLLDQVGKADEPPTIPLNVVADFAGGGLFLVVGVLAALVERERSGTGQVVDAAMLHGVAYLQAMVLGLRQEGLWADRRGTNFVDGSRPYYATYSTAAGGAVAVGCLENRFYAEFLDRLGLDPQVWEREDPARWPAQQQRLREIFGSEERAHWEKVFAGSDACVTPVLTLAEAARHPHVIAERVFAGSGPDAANPAPRFTRAHCVEHEVER